MRRRVEWLLKVGPGISSKLEFSAESKSLEGVTIAVEDSSPSSETATGVNTCGVAVTVKSDANSASSELANIKFSCSGRASAGNGA